MSTFEKIANTIFLFIGGIIFVVVAVGLLSLLILSIYGVIVLGINEIFDANIFNPYLWLVEATGGFPQGSFYR